MRDFGEIEPLSINIKDSNGDPANATSVIVAISEPDGTIITSSPISPTIVGQYDYPFLTTQAGRHQVTWTATGANAGKYTTVFEVSPALEQTFIGLAEMKAYLNIRADKTDWDEELRDAIAGGCSVVEFLCGPIAARTYTEYYDGGDPTIVLYHRPVLKVTTVTETYGLTSRDLVEVDMPDVTGALNAFTVNLATGEIRRRSLNWMYWFPYGKRNVKVVYSAGRLSTPPNVKMGTKELVGHLWRLSQLNSEGRRPRIAQPEPVTVVMGFAVPNRVLEMLQATPRIPSIG